MERGNFPKETQVDLFWRCIANMKTGGDPRFPVIAKITKALLCVYLINC